MKRNPSVGKKLAAIKNKARNPVVRAVASAAVGAYVAGQAARAKVNQAMARRGRRR